MKATCPHCGSEADVEETSDGGFRCQLCGGPRIVVDDPDVEISGREVAPLKRAQKLRLQRAVWATAAGVVGGFGLLSAVVVLGVLLLASPGLAAWAVSLLAVSFPLVLAMALFGRFRHLSEEMRAAIDKAWRSAAEDVVVGQTGELTARDLARILRSDEDRAELLLAELSARDVARRRVTDHGDLAYSAPKMRVETDETAEDEAVAEAEAEAATAAAEEKKKRASKS